MAEYLFRLASTNRYKLRWWIVVFCFAAAGCDPCSGITTCGDGPSVRYEGDLRLKFAGRPAANLRVDFVRSGGVSIGRDTVTMRTDSTGRFHLDVAAQAPGEVQGTLLIYPPGLAEPVRNPVSLVTSRSDADIGYLGTFLVPHLHFGSYGFLYFRGGPLYVSNGIFARGIEVEFRRTGGIRVDPENYVVKTNGAAEFPLDPIPLETGEVIFELIVRPPAPYQPLKVSDLRMSTRATEQPGRTLFVRLGLGPHLPYVGTLVYADTRQPATGVEVEFRRTGGIQLARDSYLTQVNEFGNFHLGPVPLESGTVIADLVVRPPSPYSSFTIRNVQLQTTEEEVELVPAGVWEIPEV